MHGIVVAGAVAALALSQGVSESIVLETPTGAVHGTLLMPANVTGRVPVVLVIAGSGPTDRDGNSPALPGPNNSLKQLAEGLAAEGFATVRYDKRGIAASAAAARAEADLRFTTYVDDAAAWIRKLAADPRFSSVSVIGHSEGSLIGVMAAREAGASAFVSIAGAGRPIVEVLTEQLSRNLPPELMSESTRIMEELKKGRTVSAVPPQLAALFRPSVQPYMISWIPLDPAAELARFSGPSLIVQGTTDIQTSITDAERLAKADSRAKLLVIDGMNHVLKEVREPARQLASYGDPALPLHPALVPGIADFLRQQRQQSLTPAPE